ncbi:MAG: biotin/lipoyl-containing protein [Acidobacteriota bacterium]|nr:biotin/lipoyl-containing protein [Acidobacteriota bacterium]
MKVTLETAESKLSISFDLKDHSLKANVDGKPYEGTLLNPEPNVYLVLIDGKVYEYRVFSNSEGELVVYFGDQSITFKPTELRGRKQSKVAEAGKMPITAPMPGRVVNILRNVGDLVTEGQGVVVVEAMKMQNEMTAPKSGKVVKINVSVGQAVSSGEVLAVIE